MEGRLLGGSRRDFKDWKEVCGVWCVEDKMEPNAGGLE